MWKKTSVGLIQTIDDTRFNYKNRMYDFLLAELKLAAQEYETNLGFMLENGYENFLKSDEVPRKPAKQNSKKIQFMTTCDEELWEKFKAFAKNNNLTLTQAIECSIPYIVFEDCKKEGHRYRIE